MDEAVKEEKVEKVTNNESKNDETGKKENNINDKKEEENIKKTEENTKNEEINKKEEKEKNDENKKEQETSKKQEEIKKEENPEDKFKQKEIDKKSFCYIPTLIKTNTLKAPFPIRLTKEQLTVKYDLNYLKDYLIKDFYGVYCLNQEVVDKQSGIIKEVVTQLTKCIWSGTAMSLSLPIRIFEPRSMLERYTDWFSFAPDLLGKAGSCKDKVEAFKYVIFFSLSALFRSTEQLKPLNPMLGETYECEWEDGSKFYLEHTCHTPPISHFYIKSSKDLYTVSGYIEMEMGGIMKAMFKNSMLMIPKGKITVYLPLLKQTISFQFPKITMGGAIWGQRYIYFSDHMKFIDVENNLKAIIVFANGRKELKGKRIHDIYGKLFKYVFTEKELKKPFYNDSLPSYPFPSKQEDVIDEITGSWLEEIKIGDKSFDIKNTVAPQIYPSDKVLDSDARYREDKQWLKLSWDNKEFGKTFEGYGQCWKLALEAQQRYERGLRKEYKEHKNKKKK